MSGNPTNRELGSEMLKLGIRLILVTAEPVYDLGCPISHSSGSYLVDFSLSSKIFARLIRLQGR
jgi:hypothetical protein